jgi:magnesium transporter
MQISTRLYDPGTGKHAEGGEELIAEWRDSPHAILWVDIAKNDVEAERQLMTETFDLHPLAVQDALRDRHPPKIETFSNALFILLRGLDSDTTGIDFGVLQLSIFVGDRFLLTRHNKKSVSVGLLRKDLLKRPETMAAGPGALAVMITNKLIRRYLEILLGLEPRLEELETEIFEVPSDEQLAELTKYKSALRQISRIANYHLEIARQMQHRRNLPFIPEDLEHEVIDVYEQLERTVSLATLYYEMAHDLTDAYLGFASHRLNRVMQILTVFTVIFVPLTFLAGIYGMNFENMPELHSSYGYFTVLGAMGVLAISLFIYFRRRHWV